MTEAAPNLVWDAFFCENAVPHLDLELNFRASAQERALLEAEISEAILLSGNTSPEELCLGAIDGSRGGFISLHAEPTANASALRSALRAVLERGTNGAELGPEVLQKWCAPVGKHDEDTIPLGTMLGFVDE